MSVDIMNCHKPVNKFSLNKLFVTSSHKAKPQFLDLVVVLISNLNPESHIKNIDNKEEAKILCFVIRNSIMGLSMETMKKTALLRSILEFPFQLGHNQCPGYPGQIH